MHGDLILRFGLLCIVLTALAGCSGGRSPSVSESKTANVEISGTVGMRWSGTITGGLACVIPGTATFSDACQGRVPETISVLIFSAGTVRATIHKVDPGRWKLTVCIEFRGDRECSTTTDEFGVAFVGKQIS